MKRRSFTHDYSYRGYFHITISTARHLRQPLGSVCGNINATDDEPDSPHVELTPIGQMVQHELLESIPHHYPMLEVDTYVIMPEHLHILLHAKRDIFSSSGKRTHLGRVIGGFKLGCNRRYWEMTGLIPAGSRPEKQGAGLMSETSGAIALSPSPSSPSSFSHSPFSHSPFSPPPSPASLPLSPASPPPSSASPTFTPSLIPPVAVPPATSAPSAPSLSRALNDSVVELQPSLASPALPPLFEAGYCDVIPVDESQLSTQRAYIRHNPRSRLLRTTNRARLMPSRGGIDTAVSLPAMCGYLRRECHPALFTPAIWQQLQDRFLIENGHIACDSYGDRQLLERHLLPVVCHRRTAARLATQKSRCIEAAAAGAILVSARIARGEQEIMDAALTSGFPVILIEDNGFSDRYHPSTDRLDACADNRLLLVTPWRYLFRRKDDAIHVPFCKAMNCIAQALCRKKDDWWEN